MSSDAEHYAVHALTWTREKGYVKVPHPVSRRLVFLPGDLGEIFQLLDEGLDSLQVVSEMAKRYPGRSAGRVRELIDLLLQLKVVDVVTQFD